MEQSKALEIDGQIIYGRDQFWLISTSQKENSKDRRTQRLKKRKLNFLVTYKDFTIIAELTVR